MDEAEGDPLGGEGTSAQPHPQSKGKQLAHVVSSSERTSTTVSSSSHGRGDGGVGAGDSGTGAISEYYQHDEEDAIPIEDVQDFPKRMEGNRGYQRRRRVSPPTPPLLLEVVMNKEIWVEMLEDNKQHHGLIRRTLITVDEDPHNIFHMVNCN
eukprot:TRINITY_DN10289_c0_g1_i11.p1 TRINITY_DN10289_c0_g1~~TRINITY_DN10289_c0_g1_i11.p1  ORF type:complete len:153 (+),score=27.49 TRINITY_DN10289_c0_g1_i11:342-800(+)